MNSALLSLSIFKKDPVRSRDYFKWLNESVRIGNTKKGLLQAYGKFISFNVPFVLCFDTLEVNCGKKMRFNTVMASKVDGIFCSIVHMELVPPDITLSNFEVYSIKY